MVIKYPCPRLESGVPCPDQSCIPCQKNMAYEFRWQACLANADPFLKAELTVKQVLSLHKPGKAGWLANGSLRRACDLLNPERNFRADSVLS